MSEQTPLELHGLSCFVESDGSVNVYCDKDFRAFFTPEDFNRLVEAQRNAVWTAQHWTSLVQVSDALASLLAVHPGVRVHRVERQSDDTGNQYYNAILVLADGLWECVDSTSNVQKLFQRLNEQPTQ